LSNFTHHRWSSSLQFKKLFDWIKNEMKNFSNFFDAQTLHKEIIKKDTTIGIATIYRFLKDFQNEGKLHSYLCNRRAIYSTNKENHCHFTCKICKKTKHLDIKKVDFLKSGIVEEVCHFQIDLTGICQDCLKK